MYPLVASVMLILALNAATLLRDGAPYMPWAGIGAAAVGNMVIVVVLGVKRWKRTRP
jgi:membrane protein YdbS with pleckstrin-like domain